MNPLAQLLEERARLKEYFVAETTRRAYGFDWSLFERWCAGAERAPLPATADTVSLYITDLLRRGKAVTTAVRHLSAICWTHRARNLAVPMTSDVKTLIKAARRLRTTRPRQMRPLEVGELRRIAGALLDLNTARGARDRAILVIGFASALRRSNLASLRLADLEVTREGLVLYVRREKQDQAAKGRYIGLPRGEHAETCPARAFQDWLAHRGRHEGFVFTRIDDLHHGLAGETICRIIQRAVRLAGVDATDVGAHSLRAGLVTAAAEAGAGELLIAAQTGHRDMNVLRGYYRRRQLFRANVAGLVGL